MADSYLLINAGGYLRLNTGAGDYIILNETPPTPFAAARQRRPSLVYKPELGDVGSVTELLVLRNQAAPTNLLLLRAAADNLNVRTSNLARVRSVALARPIARGHLPESAE